MKMPIFEEVSYLKLWQKNQSGLSHQKHTERLQVNKKERIAKYREVYEHREEDGKFKDLIGRYCTNNVFEILKKYNSSHCNEIIISGGQMCAYFYDKSWQSDLDIFVSYDCMQKIYGKRIAEYLMSNSSAINYDPPSFLSNDFSYRIAVNGSTSDFHYMNPHIMGVITYRTMDGRIVQIIALHKGITPWDTVDNFDIDCCKIFYDGFKVWNYPGLKYDEMTIYQEFFIKEELFLQKKIPQNWCKWVSYNYERTQERKKKYEKRGFKFLPLSENPGIMMNFKPDFPKTSFTNLCLVLGRCKYYLDGGFFARHSEMVMGMFSGSFRNSVDEMNTIDISHLTNLNPITLNDILKYFYRLKTMKVTGSSFWGWLEFCEFFGISTLCNSLRNKEEIIFDSPIEVKHLIAAYRYELSVYNKMIKEFCLKFKELDNIDEFFQIQNDDVRRHVLIFALRRKFSLQKFRNYQKTDQVDTDQTESVRTALEFEPDSDQSDCDSYRGLDSDDE